jgi:hypothetical protein
MNIIIPIEELDPEFYQDFKWNRVYDLHLDYATNAIHGRIRDDKDNRDLIFFRFKGYGFVHDNRSNNYILTGGPAGILITITKNSRES